MAMSTRATAQRLGPERDLTVPETSPTTPDVVAMTTSGTRYLAAYRDAATVGTDIVVYDSAPIAFVGLPLLVHEVACAGDDCVALGNFLDGSRVGLVRFRTDGTLIDAAPIAVSVATRPGSIARLGASFVVASPVGVEVAVSRFDFATGVVGPAVFRASATFVGFDCGPSDCLLVYYGGQVTAQRLSAALVPTGAPIDLNSGTYEGLPDVAYTGIDYAVLSGFGYRINSSDAVLTTPSTLNASGLACDGAGTCVCASSDNRFLVWTRTATAAQVNPVGSVPYLTSMACALPNQCAALGGMPRAIRLPDAIVSSLPSFGRRADQQTGPVAVAGGPAGNIAFYVQQVGPAGAPLLPGPTARPEALAGVPAPIDLVYAGDRFGAVTVENTHLAVFGLDGTLLETPTPLPVSAYRAAIAWNGTHFLAAWINRSDRNVSVQRFNRIGERVDVSPLTIELGAENGFTAREVTASSFGGEFLVAYTNTTQVRSRRIRADGTAIGTGPSVLRDREARSLQLRASETGYVIAWQEQSTMDFAVYNFDIRVARLSATGENLDLGGRSVGTGQYQASDVGPELAIAPVPDGAVVAWSSTLGTPEGVRTIRAATLKFDGAVTVEDVLSEPFNDLRRPTGLSLGGYPLPSLVFGRSMTDPDHRPLRVRVRTFLATSLGATCTAPSDCDSNFCVDGICCNAACDGACDTCSAVGMCTPMMCDAGMAVALDTGTPAMTDAGIISNIDAAVAPPPPSGGCTASSRAPMFGWFAALGVILATRRRRRAH